MEYRFLYRRCLPHRPIGSGDIGHRVSCFYFHDGGDHPTVAFPRNLIVAGDDRRLRLAETFLSASGGPHLTNTVTEIVGGADATIDYYMVQRQSTDSFHVSTVQADSARDATLTPIRFRLALHWRVTILSGA